MTDDGLLNPNAQSLTTRALRLADVVDDGLQPASGHLVRELVAEVERLRGVLARVARGGAGVTLEPHVAEAHIRELGVEIGYLRAEIGLLRIEVEVHRTVGLVDEIEQLKAKVSDQDEVIEQRNAMVQRAEAEVARLRKATPEQVIRIVNRHEELEAEVERLRGALARIAEVGGRNGYAARIAAEALSFVDEKQSTIDDLPSQP